MTPFVKWAGGKTQLLNTLKNYVPPKFGTYYEPFVGGGAFFLHLRPVKAVINDINPQLINIYIQLRDNLESVINALKFYDSTECNKEKYLSLRKYYNDKCLENILDAESAALMIWLNKHCFNGLYRVNSKGLFNVPYNNKSNCVSFVADNLKEIGYYLASSDIKIMCADFETACKNVKSEDFIYFDPPYAPMSETANFTNYTKTVFSFAEQIRLAKLFGNLSNIGAFAVLSNNNVPSIKELYKQYFFKEISVRRNINRNGKKRTGEEIIVSNYLPNKISSPVYEAT